MFSRRERPRAAQLRTTAYVWCDDEVICGMHILHFGIWDFVSVDDGNIREGTY